MYFIADTVSPVFSSSDMENTAANCPYYSPCVFLPSALAQGEGCEHGVYLTARLNGSVM